MKKIVLRIILAFLIVLACVLLVKAVIILLFANTNAWKLSAEYKEYASDFNNVKNYVASEFSGKWGKVLSVESVGGNEVKLYDRETDEHLDLPDDVAESLNVIYHNAFPDKNSYLSTIGIYEEGISFCIYQLPYALVYSPDARPTWLRSPDDNVDVRVRKIKDGWYHVIKDK